MKIILIFQTRIKKTAKTFKYTDICLPPLYDEYYYYSHTIPHILLVATFHRSLLPL
jgi:hypothetical protein